MRDRTRRAILVDAPGAGRGVEEPARLRGLAADLSPRSRRVRHARRDSCSGRPIQFAFLHPIEVLQGTVRELGTHLGIELDEEPDEFVTGEPTREAEPNGAVTSEPTEEKERGGQDRPKQPRTSTAVLKRKADGFVLTLPDGPQRDWRNQFAFAVLCCAILPGLYLWGIREPGGIIVGACCLSPFWLFGIASLISAIRLRGPHATIVIGADSLRIALREFSGAITRYEWRKVNIESIEVGFSPLYWKIPQLEIHAEGGTVDLCNGRDEAELKWVAALLCDEL